VVEDKNFDKARFTKNFCQEHALTGTFVPFVVKESVLIRPHDALRVGNPWLLFSAVSACSAVEIL
jgi:hypothetical protein